MTSLATLDASAHRFDLPVWEPSLAFEAKQHLMRLLAQRIETLIGELTAIDAARAVALD
jgi:type VI secretion system protein VasJ